MLAGELGLDHAALASALRYAQRRVGRELAPDVVQSALLRVWSAQSKRAPSDRRVNAQYLRLAVRSVIANAAADRAEERAYREHLPSSGDEADQRAEARLAISPPAGRVARIEDEPDFRELEDRAQGRMALLLRHAQPPSQLSGASNAAWRQERSRARRQLEATVITRWIQHGQLDRLNKYRPTESMCRRVAKLLVADEVRLGVLQEIFEHRELNRTIQTATWVMTHLGTIRPDHADLVWNHLEGQLHACSLYRGNLTYITEALIGVDRSRGVDLFRNTYLKRVQDMEARVQKIDLPFYDQAPVRGPCIYDIKHVPRLGAAVPLSTVRTIRKLYASGVHDVDLHRSLAFVLLRTRPNDSQGLDDTICSLVHETDQTNAYYVIRYIMKWGVKEAPHILTARTLQSIRAVARRWPQTTYFTESASRFKRRQLRK